jgi:hypothetical protein
MSYATLGGIISNQINALRLSYDPPPLSSSVLARARACLSSTMK